MKECTSGRDGLSASCARQGPATRRRAVPCSHTRRCGGADAGGLCTRASTQATRSGACLVLRAPQVRGGLLPVGRQLRIRLPQAGRLAHGRRGRRAAPRMRLPECRDLRAGARWAPAASLVAPGWPQAGQPELAQRQPRPQAGGVVGRGPETSLPLPESRPRPSILQSPSPTLSRACSCTCTPRPPALRALPRRARALEPSGHLATRGRTTGPRASAPRCRSSARAATSSARAAASCSAPAAPAACSSAASAAARAAASASATCSSDANSPSSSRSRTCGRAHARSRPAALRVCPTGWVLRSRVRQAPLSGQTARCAACCRPADPCDVPDWPGCDS